MSTKAQFWKLNSAVNVPPPLAWRIQKSYAIHTPNSEQGITILVHCTCIRQNFPHNSVCIEMSCRIENSKIRIRFLKRAKISSYPCHSDRLWGSPPLLRNDCRHLLWDKTAGSVKLTTHFYLIQRLNMRGTVPPIATRLHGVTTFPFIYGIFFWKLLFVCYIIFCPEETCPYVGIQVFTAMTVKSLIIWVVKPCISENFRRFGGTHRLHIQGRRFSQARNQYKEAANWARFILASWNGGYIFFWNLRPSPDFTASQPRRRYSSDSTVTDIQVKIFKIY
jgi:hypothetical protein